MKSFMAALVAAAVVVACASRSNSANNGPRRTAVVEPVRYGYNVKAVYQHLKSSYKQGLQFADGVLWEGTGEWGESVLQRVDLESGKAEVLVRLPRNEFGEGITVLGDKIYQLTWTNNTVHIYDLNGKLLKNVRYPGEGWGLTSDGERLYMSNGSSQIYRVAPDSFKREGSFTVTLRGEPVQYINELEWIDGRIWANVYTTDYVIIINPESGAVEGVVDFSGLLKSEDMDTDTDAVLGRNRLPPRFIFIHGGRQKRTLVDKYSVYARLPSYPRPTSVAVM